MLFQTLDKLKEQTIISSVVLMVIGLFMLVIPVEYDGILVSVLGYAIVLLGSVMVWDFIAKEKNLTNCIIFTASLLLILLGVFILVSGDDILKVLSVLFGILLMIDGLHSGLHAFMYARRAGRKWWWVLILLSILLFGAGIIIFNNPWWDSEHSFVKIIGGVVLFAAVVGVIRLFLVWPIRKE